MKGARIGSVSLCGERIGEARFRELGGNDVGIRAQHTEGVKLLNVAPRAVRCQLLVRAHPAREN